MAGDSQGSADRRDRRDRLYVLALFSLSNFMQCMGWFTFSSVEDSKFRDYYAGGALPGHASRAEVGFQTHLLLNWGPICGVLLFPVQGWLLVQPDGLRRTLWIALTLVMLGALLRCLPTFVSPFTLTAGAVFGMPWLSMALLHAGQILNACAGPFLMASTSRLSVIWFPESQRATATAVATTANGAGVTLCFLLAPWLVPAAGDFPRLLVFELACAALPWLLGALYLPGAPSSPPSAAAAAVAAGEEAPESFRHGLALVLANRGYGALVLAAGILAGAGAAWQGVLHDILSPGYSDVFVGCLGFANSVASNAGAVAAGKVADSGLARRRFKLLILLGVGVVILAGVGWSLSCARGGNAGLLVCLISIMGLGNGMANPLFYELGAELTYPAPEGTSAGVLVLIWNLTTLIMIFLPVGLGLVMNWVYIALTVLSLALVCMVRELHRRPAGPGGCTATLM